MTDAIAYSGSLCTAKNSLAMTLSAPKFALCSINRLITLEGDASSSHLRSGYSLMQVVKAAHHHKFNIVRDNAAAINALCFVSPPAGCRSPSLGQNLVGSSTTDCTSVSQQAVTCFCFEIQGSIMRPGRCRLEAPC